MLLEDFDNAEKILQEGRDRADDPRYNQALAGVYAAQVGRAGEETPRGVSAIGWHCWSGA